MTRFHIALGLTYVLFAVLLNSVGTVILQSILTWEVDKSEAAVLEAFKDLSIAIMSFVVASQLPRFGLRRGMIVGVLLVSATCAVIPLLDRFQAMQLLFAVIGMSFAVVKIATYTSIGLLTRDNKGHASLLTLIEGVFMVGVLGGYWLFAAFIDPQNPASTSWLRVYWLLAGLALVTAGFLAVSRLDESAIHTEGPAATTPVKEFAAMLGLVLRPLVLVFVACVFLYVFIEQGVGTWLPTFNKKIIGLSAPMSVQMTSLFPAGTLVGRLVAGIILARMPWRPFLSICLGITALLVVITLPLAGGPATGPEITTFAQVPLAAWLFLLIGVMLGPIYPTINSVMLTSLPKHHHAAMTGLIVVFSALGGTSGSLLTGRAFGSLGGVTAFYLTLVPITLLFLLLGEMHRRGQKAV